MSPLPESVRRASLISRKMILLARNMPHLVVHEWERDGQQFNAWPGDGQSPPYDSARIGLKLFTFPTGQLRLIDFGDGVRTPWHLNAYQDVLFYGLTATQVEFVNQAIHLAHPGDASIHPEGVRHHSETIVGGLRAEFAFAPAGVSGLDLVAIPGRDLTLHPVAEAIEAGTARRKLGPAAAGEASECTYTAKLFQLPGYAMLEAHHPAGTAIRLHRNAVEKIVHVVSGQLWITSGDEESEVGPGDTFRMAAGTSFARKALVDSVLLEVDGSRAPDAWAFEED